MSARSASCDVISVVLPPAVIFVCPGSGIAAITEIPGVTFFVESSLSRYGTPALASFVSPHPKRAPATSALPFELKVYQF